MKIRKDYILKLIREETRRVLRENPELASAHINKDFSDRRDEEREGIEHKLIHIYSFATNYGGDLIKDLYKPLQAMGLQPAEAIKMLDRDAVNPEMYIKAVEMNNKLIDKIGADPRGKMKVDAFPHFPEVGHNPNQDPDQGFMRVPKKDSAYSQEDTRKSKKNWV